MRSVLVILFVLAAGLQLGGCATILNGTTQDVSVSSDPPGAEVTASGNYMGVTPIVLDLQRKKNHIVTISMDGYHTEQVSVTKVMSGAVAGNILAGGFIGWGIDATSGAQYKLKPDTITVTMKRRGFDEADRGLGVASSTDMAFTIEDRLRQLDNLVQSGAISQAEYQGARQDILSELAGEQSRTPATLDKAIARDNAAISVSTEVTDEPSPADKRSSWIYSNTDD